MKQLIYRVSQKGIDKKSTYEVSGGGGVTSTHNKREFAFLTAKVAPKNPGTYLKLRPKNRETYLK